jgi:RNA polymerase sigma-70 factor (ECF subfamily)
LLENVVEEFAGRKPQARGPNFGEPDLVGQGFTRERFDEIFVAHYARIVRILRRVVGNQGQAEELASEVFLKLYRAPLAQGEGRSANLPGWLCRTATNLGIDALRAAARRNRFEQDAARDHGSRKQTVEDGFERTLRGERQQMVRAVLADLKPEQARLLLLRASGHSYKELAGALEVETGSVGTLLIRAEAAFEQRYREIYGDEGER